MKFGKIRFIIDFYQFSIYYNLKNQYFQLKIRKGSYNAALGS